jgi:hypothetical protein
MGLLFDHRSRTQPPKSIRLSLILYRPLSDLPIWASSSAWSDNEVLRADREFTPAFREIGSALLFELASHIFRRGYVITLIEVIANIYRIH